MLDRIYGAYTFLSSENGIQKDYTGFKVTVNAWGGASIPLKLRYLLYMYPRCCRGKYEELPNKKVFTSKNRKVLRESHTPYT